MSINVAISAAVGGTCGQPSVHAAESDGDDGVDGFGRRHVEDAGLLVRTPHGVTLRDTAGGICCVATGVSTASATVAA